MSRGCFHPADLVFGPTLAYRGFRLMLSHYRPSRPADGMDGTGRYDLPLRRAMLARRRTAGLRGSFRPRLPWTRRLGARNHRPGWKTKVISGSTLHPSDHAPRRPPATLHLARACARADACAAASSVAPVVKTSSTHEHSGRRLPAARRTCPREFAKRSSRPRRALVARSRPWQQRLASAPSCQRHRLRQRGRVVEPRRATAAEVAGIQHTASGHPAQRSATAAASIAAEERSVAGARPRPCGARRRAASGPSSSPSTERGGERELGRPALGAHHDAERSAAARARVIRVDDCGSDALHPAQSRPARKIATRAASGRQQLDRCLAAAARTPPCDPEAAR